MSLCVGGANEIRKWVELSCTVLIGYLLCKVFPYWSQVKRLESYSPMWRYCGCLPGTLTTIFVYNCQSACKHLASWQLKFTRAYRSPCIIFADLGANTLNIVPFVACYLTWTWPRSWLLDLTQTMPPGVVSKDLPDIEVSELHAVNDAWLLRAERVEW